MTSFQPFRIPVVWSVILWRHDYVLFHSTAMNKPIYGTGAKRKRKLLLLRSDTWTYMNIIKQQWVANIKLSSSPTMRHSNHRIGDLDPRSSKIAPKKSWLETFLFWDSKISRGYVAFVTAPPWCSCYLHHHQWCDIDALPVISSTCLLDRKIWP